MSARVGEKNEAGSGLDGGNERSESMERSASSIRSFSRAETGAGGGLGEGEGWGGGGGEGECVKSQEYLEF